MATSVVWCCTNELFRSNSDVNVYFPAQLMSSERVERIVVRERGGSGGGRLADGEASRASLEICIFSLSAQERVLDGIIFLDQDGVTGMAT